MVISSTRWINRYTERFIWTVIFVHVNLISTFEIVWRSILCSLLYENCAWFGEKCHFWGVVHLTQNALTLNRLRNRIEALWWKETKHLLSHNHTAFIESELLYNSLFVDWSTNTAKWELPTSAYHKNLSKVIVSCAIARISLGCTRFEWKTERWKKNLSSLNGIHNDYGTELIFDQTWTRCYRATVCSI